MSERVGLGGQRGRMTRATTRSADLGCVKVSSHIGSEGFPHEDGEGFNLLLQALPLDGKIVLRTYKEDEEEEKAPKGKPQYKK